MTDRLHLMVCMVGLAVLPAVTGCSRAAERFEFAHRQMGTRFQLALYCRSEPAASAAAKAAFDRVDELNRILSDYDPDSELSRLAATAGSGRAVPVSDELWTVLAASQRLARRTDGAFDVTVGPVVRLWRRARKLYEMPHERRLANALEAVGHRHVVLNPENHTVKLEKEGMRLDLGGIAKGYAADEALRVLRDHGIRRVLVDAGGDIALGDPPPGRPGWRIALRPMAGAANTPDTSGDADGTADGAGSTAALDLITADRAVATSGDAYQHVTIDGKRYSHIVDPRTGIGVHPPIAVSVVAPDAMAADGLASAVSVMGPEKGIELIDATDGAAAIIVQRTADGTLRRYESERVETLNLEPAATASEE